MLLTKADDPYLALLNYRNTPRGDGAPSPAARLLGRSTRTLLPRATTSDRQKDDTETRAVLQKSKTNQVQYYNERAKDLPPLEIGKVVRIRREDVWKPATVMKKLGRSYLVKDAVTQTVFRRNRRQLRETTIQSLPHPNPDNDAEVTGGS